MALNGSERNDDEEVWSCAVEHGYVIVSKDEDFTLQAFVDDPDASFSCSGRDGVDDVGDRLSAAPAQ